MSLQISMSHKKQHLRLWYECLQICLGDNQYSDNLKKSKDFYSSWGDVKNTKFDHWWRKNKILFKDVYVMEVDRVEKNPNTVTISIPLNEKITNIISEVKRIVGNKQKQFKNNKVKYQFTSKEFKGMFHYINLEVYKIFIDLNRPPINRNFLMEIRKRIDERKRSEIKKSHSYLPHMDDFERLKSNSDFEDQIRMMRRSLKSVEKTLLNVSLGKFP